VLGYTCSRIIDGCICSLILVVDIVILYMFQSHEFKLYAFKIVSTDNLWNNLPSTFLNLS